MLRENLSRTMDHDPDFEWRGQDVTRIENLSDIVFALALGMIVSASSPPATFDELVAFLPNIVPVTAAFAMLLMIWNFHFVYFRRYGLSDGKIIFLNALLLLLVMFIAYPLRFVFDSLFSYILAVAGYTDRIIAMQVDFTRAAQIEAVFIAGYALIFLLFSRMYAHALKHREMIGLSDREVLMTKMSLRSFYIQVGMALIILPLALFTPIGPFAPFLFFLNWPLNVIAFKILDGEQALPDKAD